TEILFGGELAGVCEATFAEIVGEVPTAEISKAQLEGEGKKLVDLLAETKLCPSKGQARKDLEGHGISLNNARQDDVERRVTTADLLFGKHLLLRKGKKNYLVVKVA
ncbi:MAG: tyrosine--tRNA ligase, partial [Deltaproteobacteria bacterium]|nr:tyrosine--tRNA ligase [Deltaproteobacteria bacterium]